MTTRHQGARPRPYVEKAASSLFSSQVGPPSKPAGRPLHSKIRLKSGSQMDMFRIALANIRFPASPEESVTLAEQAIAQAGVERANIVCFPECYVPGYRGTGKRVPPPDAAFLERAWTAIRAAAAKANVAVILGTERTVDSAPLTGATDGLIITALVINADGTAAGFQDKVQLDPSEESIYTAGSGRRIFQTDSVTFGVAICHEGWRYP